jgi:glycerol-3-phosphate acyltransferase PlsX
LQRRRLREFAQLIDSESYGGAALLGLSGTVVIAHGASRARGITSACVLASDLEQRQITEKIKERLGSGRHFLRRPLVPPPGRSPVGPPRSGPPSRPDHGVR